MVDRFHAIGMLGSRPGPPRFFDGQASGHQGQNVFGLDLMGIGLLIVAACGALVIGRWVFRRSLGCEKSAFRLLSRRLGLKRGERDAIARLAERQGVDPLGLLICESAFVQAVSGRGFRNDRISDAKPVLLTGAELNELGRVSERLYGRSVEEGLEEADASEEEQEDDGDVRTSRWVA